MAKTKKIIVTDAPETAVGVKSAETLNTQSQQTVVKEESTGQSTAGLFGDLFASVEEKASEFQAVVDAKKAFSDSLATTTQQLLAAYKAPSIPFVVNGEPTLVEFDAFLSNLALVAGKSQAHKLALVSDVRVQGVAAQYAERQHTTFLQIAELVATASKYGLKERANAPFSVALRAAVAHAVLNTLGVREFGAMTISKAEETSLMYRQLVGLVPMAKEKTISKPVAPKSTETFKAKRTQVPDPKAVVEEPTGPLTKAERDRCEEAAAGLKREALVRGWIAPTKGPDGKSRNSTVEGVWGTRDESPWVVSDKVLGTDPKDAYAALHGEYVTPKPSRPAGIMALCTRAEKWVAEMEAARK